MIIARVIALSVFAFMGLSGIQPIKAEPLRSDSRHRPVVLSASWGTEDGLGCPSGETNLDNLPVTFNWFIRHGSIQVSDFTIVLSDGAAVHPICALQFPPDETNERQTVNLIGDFGDHINGPVPVRVEISGSLRGKPPTSTGGWRPLGSVAGIAVQQLDRGPEIVDAWVIPRRLYRGDPNRCQTGSTFVRVMWSNGLTAYPTGDEVGQAVAASYEASFSLPRGRSIKARAVEVADLYDHQTSAYADNMHDLCLSDVPKGAELRGISIASDLIQDPNGDPNVAQSLNLSRRPRLAGLRPAWP